MEDVIVLYENIKKRRIALNMSQQELGELVGYKGRSMICQVEKGMIDLPSRMIIKFAEALRTTPSHLMGWEEDDLLNVSDRSDFLNSFTHEEENILRKIRELEKYYSIPEIERALDFIALYQKAIPEIQAAVESLLKSQKHDP